MANIRGNAGQEIAVASGEGTAESPFVEKHADAGPAWTTSLGVSGAAVISADLTTRTVVTDVPTSGQKLVITDIIVSADTAMFVLFEQETTNVDKLQVFVPAGGMAQFTPRGKFKLTAADKRLTATASTAGNVAITVLYYSEA